MSKQHGFTIIELMIATAVFSSLLLLCSSGLIYLGQLYYKGITSSAVQETARNAADEITYDFQLSGGLYQKLPDTSSGNSAFCIGDNLYSYKIGNRIDSDGNGHGLVLRTASNCAGLTAGDDVTNPADPHAAEWRELLGSGMRLIKLDITTDGSTNPSKAYLRINILAGENDQFTCEDAAGQSVDCFNGTNFNTSTVFNAVCKGGFGGQSCANSQLSTLMARRLR